MSLPEKVRIRLLWWGVSAALIVAALAFALR